MPLLVDEFDNGGTVPVGASSIDIATARAATASNDASVVAKFLRRSHSVTSDDMTFETNQRRLPSTAISSDAGHHIPLTVTDVVAIPPATMSFPSAQHLASAEEKVNVEPAVDRMTAIAGNADRFDHANDATVLGDSAPSAPWSLVDSEDSDASESKARAAAGRARPGTFDGAAAVGTPTFRPSVTYDAMFFDGDYGQRKRARTAAGYVHPVLDAAKKELDTGLVAAREAAGGRSARPPDPDAARRSKDPIGGEGGMLPLELWEVVLSYCDVPVLGACARTSKLFGAASTKDEVWKIHLKKLLRTVFDGAFYIDPKSSSLWQGRVPVPISERPPRSTEFRKWHAEWTGRHEVRTAWGVFDRSTDVRSTRAARGAYSVHDGFEWSELGIRDVTTSDVAANGGASAGGPRCRWILEDVPLRTYYRDAADFARLGYSKDRVRCDGDDFYDEFENERGLSSGHDRDAFEGLPNINLFRRLAGSPRRPRCEYDY